MTKGIFITGTGTDVGKTYVTALLVKALSKYSNVAYYKAAMSGNERDADGKLIPGDAQWVKNISGIPQPLSSMCPYVYQQAVSPHLAARLEGNPVSLTRIKDEYACLSQQYDHVVMEGSGGILCPIRYDQTIIFLEDMIKALSLPSIIVADAGLGTINSVVLTVEYMKSHQLPVKGIIYNSYHPGNLMEDDNIHMCQCLTKLPTIATVCPGDTELSISKEALEGLFN